MCSTVSLLGITGVLAPILEETVFRGFFMVSLTKWYDSFSITLITNIKLLHIWLELALSDPVDFLDLVGET